MPEAGVTLDASAFPHIVDLVLAHTPVADLLPLRLVSRDFRDRVDAEIDGYHVQLLDHRWRCRHRCSPPYAVTPAHAKWSDKARRPEYCVQTLPASLPRTLVKVVQFAVTASPTGIVEAINSIGTVNTLQRSGPGIMGNFPPSGWSSKLVNVVDFLHLQKDCGSRDSLNTIVLPDSTRRYVLHVAFEQIAEPRSRWRPSTHLQDLRRIRIPASGMREFVLVLWPIFKPDEGPEEPYDTFPHVLHSLLLATAQIAIKGGTVTIVGADRISPLLLGRPERKAKVRSAVVDEVKARRLQWSENHRLTPGQAEEADKRTRWLTVHEWWDELGFRRQYEGLAVGSEHVADQETETMRLLFRSECAYGTD
ncbi:hypothetical protein Q8F55_000020 [Vanrija albida]|uniref:F-box domain-containing protein n=1 Tax=Vanrija albida TaxID=181172 RepID=A0ABR3QD27_9TREE